MKWKDISFEGYQSKLEQLKTLTPNEILEVGRDASIQEIKAAHRAKMKIYHPDKNSDFTKEYAEEVGKLLNNAYQALLTRIENDKK